MLPPAVAEAFAGYPAPVRWVASTPSTQDVARAWAAEGARHGAVVLAGRQEAGRGRLGRSWVGAEGNLAMTVVLRPAQLGWPSSRLGLLNLAAAVAVAQAAPGLGIKWPNDLLLPDGRKVAGLLAEAEFGGGRAKVVLVGVGVNVASAPWPGSGCLADLGGAWDPRVLAAQIASRMLEQLALGPDAVIEAWTRRNITLGRRVRVGQVEGFAEQLAADGALGLRLDDGERYWVHAGDVALVGRLEDRL